MLSRVFWHLPSRLPAAAPGACLGEGFYTPPRPLSEGKASVFNSLPSSPVAEQSRSLACRGCLGFPEEGDGATLAPAAPTVPEQVLPSSSYLPTQANR